MQLLTKLLAAEGLRVGVKAEENTLVGKGVLVLRPGTLLGLGTGRADNRLYLGAVDNASDVGVADLRGGQAKACVRNMTVTSARTRLTSSPSSGGTASRECQTPRQAQRTRPRSR
jgi:hypothetical protein